LSESDLSELTTISMPDTLIGDKTAALLAKCPKLTRVQLTGTQVTDTGLRALLTSRSLELLIICGTRVTEAECQRGRASNRGMVIVNWIPTGDPSRLMLR
jgi:hypothetical protein